MADIIPALPFVSLHAGSTDPQPSSRQSHRHWTADRASGRRYGRRLRLVHRAGTRTLKRNARKNSNDWHFGATAVSGAVTGGSGSRSAARGRRSAAAPLSVDSPVSIDTSHRHTHTHTHTHMHLSALSAQILETGLTFSRASCHPLETIAPILVHTLRQTTEPCVRLLESTRRSVSDD